MTAGRLEPIDVALVQMPFAVAARPSLGLSLLQSACRERGIASRVCYLNLGFVAAIGPEVYETIALGAPQVVALLGEWVFAEALWGCDPRRDELYLTQVLGSADAIDPERFRRLAIGSRGHVDGFLDACLAAQPWSTMKLIGFTSMFQQHVASLALAKRLKDLFPHLCIVFGGANCEGEMGSATLRNFPFVDAVCDGEGDHAFPEFAQSYLRSGQVPTSVAGMLTRQPASLGAFGTGGSRAAPAADLDGLPYPDFADYFEALGDAPSLGSIPVHMVFETSRGCWWGRKHHCTFCGLNGLAMAFRSKSSGRALDEIAWLLARHGHRTHRLAVSDNIIPMEYFQTLLPQLEALNLDLELFYETKANLTEAQVAQCKRSGLHRIQPGIESLNQATLQLMRKGVSPLQNIQLLKWCAQYDVSPAWNYLYGFPGESPASYHGQPDLLAAIVHLTPPASCGPVRFDRFSPYTAEPTRFGLAKLVPYPAYAHVYPALSSAERARLAYYFEGSFDGQELIPTYAGAILAAVEQWQRSAGDATLCHSSDDGLTRVFDGRDVTAALLVETLEGVDSAAFERCSTIATRAAIYRDLRAAGHAEEAVDEALGRLTARRLVLREGDSFLAVSIPLGHSYIPPPGALEKMFAHLGARDG